VSGPVSKVGWKIVGGAATAAGGAAASKSINLAYRKLRGEPPLNPAHPDMAWRDAMIWALVSAVAITLGRLAGERVAAAGWLRATGALPPGMEPID
jgi:hypothetical protein